MVAALAVFLGTVPLRLGSMVDFLGFDADVVKLPDASDMPPRGRRREAPERGHHGEVQGPEAFYDG
jgi:hypothetical protein